MARQHGDAQVAGHRLLDGLVAAEFEPQVGTELLAPEVRVDGHPRT